MVALAPPWWMDAEACPIDASPWTVSTDEDGDQTYDGGWHPDLHLRLATTIRVNAERVAATLGCAVLPPLRIRTSWYSGSARRGGMLGDMTVDATVTGDAEVVGQLPSGALRDVNLERSVVLTGEAGGAPAGAVIWSDTWSTRTQVQLEGAGPGFGVMQMALPDNERHSLWRVVVDADDPDATLSQAVRVMLNEPKLTEMFPTKQPDSLTAALIRADVLISVTRAMLHEHAQVIEAGPAPGTVAALAHTVLGILSESVGSATALLERSPNLLESRLRSHCLAELVGPVR